MAKIKIPQPSDLETQVLSLLWESDAPMTVRQILESLPDGRKRAYTTVLTVMQVMEKKGLVAHEAEGVRHVYRPMVRKSDVVGPMLRNLVRNIFGGSPAAAMQNLLSETAVSPTELQEIQRVIEEAAKASITKTGRSAKR